MVHFAFLCVLAAVLFLQAWGLQAKMSAASNNNTLASAGGVTTNGVCTNCAVDVVNSTVNINIYVVSSTPKTATPTLTTTTTTTSVNLLVVSSIVVTERNHWEGDMSMIDWGKAVAVDGSLVVVGAALTPDERRGAAWVYDTSGQLLANLSATDSQRNDFFGGAVAIDDGVVVVGAYARDDSTGMAYIFSTARGGQAVNNTWEQVAKISPSERGEMFGFRVAIDHNVVVVGAPGKNQFAGGVYIFNTSGQMVTTISASDAEPQDRFGRSVAVDKDVVVVGSRAVNRRDLLNPGSAYIFNRTTWQQLANIFASDAQSFAGFGYAVAVDHGVVVVGAPHADHFHGSAYIFDTSGQQLGQLSASDAAEDDPSAFGTSVAIDHGIIVVGAPAKCGYVCGGAYIFNRTGQQLANVEASNSPHAMGRGVAVSHGDILISGYDGNSHGLVYAFGTDQTHDEM